MRLLPTLLLSLFVVSSCSGIDGLTDVEDATVFVEVVAETGTDVIAIEDQSTLPELVIGDKSSPDDTILDINSDSQTPQCAPGEGCFLDPCEDNDECQSGWCVQHLGDGVCSEMCQEECAPGWSCQQVAGTDPDVVFICVSDFANLCRPCHQNVDCTNISGAADACIDYGPDGNFCGGACEDVSDCPWGFSCVDAITVEGTPLKQCVNDTGECPCTDSSVALGLTTSCTVTNDLGMCTGKRVCTADGLTSCDSMQPAEEACNGIDDNCDGDIDEPFLVEGDFINLCNDNNGCTEDKCQGENGCMNTVLKTGDCNDGNPCTVADHCETGTCTGTPVDCSDDNPCTEDLCTDTGGCEYSPVFASCDDEDPCTVVDQCQDGICLGTPVNCDCQSDDDCATLEDGDLCNGTLFCDTDALPYKCVVVPDSEVICPEAEGIDAVCLQPSCAPETGECSFIPDNDELACSDPDACTINEFCTEGVCGSGGPINCNDGNPCTDDVCDSEAGCVHTPNTIPCNDDNVCTTQDQCESGECVGGDILVCEDSNPCTSSACDPAVGCTLAPLTDGACDDGNACTLTDLCSAEGICVGSGAVACGDDNPCTDNTCDPGIGCVTVLNEAMCSDNDVCTTGDHCHLGACISSGTFTCNDSNICTDDVCDPAVGCVHTPNNMMCNDGNECTGTDTCAGGICTGTEPVICTDGNFCTDDVCDPKEGCVFTFNAAPCNDGDLCSTDDTCSAGSCTSGPQLNCSDDNPCTDDSCEPATGCSHQPNAAACDDQNACTTTDQCANGACTGSGMPTCDDGNVCTSDSCNPATGCQHAPLDNIVCDDNNPCTLTDKCSNSSCVGSGQLDCDDNDMCTADSCEAPDGCSHEPAGFLPCDDSNECTTDSCEAATGCAYVAVTDYTPCQGDQVCLGGTCQAAPDTSIVFVTKGKFTGNLGGLSGADAKCQTEAIAAGLQGTFVAFLSTDTINARDRIPDAAYKRVDNTVVADNKADLLDGSLDAPINLNAQGGAETNTARPWTASHADGTTTGYSCANWTNDDNDCGLPNGRTMCGDSGQTNSNWLVYTEYCCWATFTRLYCFRTAP